MSQLNVAVIGCGSWGVNHARVYSDLPMVRLAAVSDIDAKRVQKCSRKHSANGFTDTLKVLEDPDIDAVSFCTPTCTHSHIAEKALLNDKHVLVEKPMTDTVDEAQGLIELAEDVGLNLTVGFVERFNPAVRLSKRLIDDGEIGRVIMAHAKRVTRRPDRVGDIGVIKDLGIHDIDVITHLMGEPPETVYATAGSHMHTFEDYANITL
nr:Gfo/Idh/MocA family oxidoreductase [Candidatus Bathyarchaeota archaeon]